MVVVTIDSKPFYIHVFFFTLVNKYAFILARMCVCACDCTHWKRWRGRDKQCSHILAQYPLWAPKRAPETQQMEEMNDLFTFWMRCKICKRQMKSLSKSISLRQQHCVKLLLEVGIKLWNWPWNHFSFSHYGTQNY